MSKHSMEIVETLDYEPPRMMALEKIASLQGVRPGTDSRSDYIETDPDEPTEPTGNEPEEPLG